MIKGQRREFIGKIISMIGNDQGFDAEPIFAVRLKCDHGTGCIVIPAELADFCVCALKDARSYRC